MASTYTPNYNLAQFVGTHALYDPVDEFRRWTTVDTNLKAIANLVGAGVVYGWDLAPIANSLYVNISPGNGFVDSTDIFAAETTSIATILVSANIATNSPYYVVAQERSDTYYTGLVDFSAQLVAPSDAIILGQVSSDADSILYVVPSYRTYVGYSEDLANRLDTILLTHEHDGVTSPKIDLSTMVTGLLSPDNIDTIPFSKISGNFSASIVGSISHKNLADIGNYDHNKLDTFVDYIATNPYESLGEILLTNHIQNTITLTHAFGQEPQQYLVNERAVIPGFTGSWIATDSYTLLSGSQPPALLDYTNHWWAGTYAATKTPVSDAIILGNYNNNNYTGQAGLLNDWAGKLATQSNIELYQNANNNNNYELRLKSIASYPIYANSGFAELIFDSGKTLANWKELNHNSVIPNCASVTFAFQTANDLRSFRDDLYTINYSAVPYDLTPLSNNQYLKIKYNFYTASVTQTPIVSTIAVSYNTIQDEKFAYSYLDTKEDWYTGIVKSDDYITLENIPGAISLKDQERYEPNGYFISTYLDGTATLHAWGFLYTDAIIPDGSTITWQGRTGTSAQYLIDYPNADWANLDSIAANSGVYDLSPYRYQYLQLQANYNNGGQVGKTPEILSLYTTNYCLLPTSIATCMEYKRWTMDSSGINGFLNNYEYKEGGINKTWPAVINNIATSAIIGGLTTLDPASGWGRFESAPFKPALLNGETFEWNNISIYGENFSSQTVMISIYMSANPALSNIPYATYTATTSPFTLDLSAASNYQKTGYLYYKLDFTD